MELKGLPQVLNLDPLRLLEGQGSLNTLLAQLGGSEVEAILAGRTLDGLLLQLLDGRTLTAGGDLPFPDGTALLLRAVPAPEAGALRLQLLQATPPAPAPALAPLAQGEAHALLQRILGPEPLHELLAPLRALFAEAAEPPAAPAPVPAPPALAPSSAPAATTSASPPAPSALSAPAPTAAPTPQAPIQAPAQATPPVAADPIPLLRAWIAQALPEVDQGAAAPVPRAETPLPATPALVKELVSRGLPEPKAQAWAAFLLDAEGAAPPPAGALEDLIALAPEPPPALPPAPAPPLLVPPSLAPFPAAPALEARPAPTAEVAGAPGKVPADPAVRSAVAAIVEDLRRAQAPDALLQRLPPLLLLARPSGGGAIEQLLRALLPDLPAPATQKTATPPIPLPLPNASALSHPPPAQLSAAWREPETWEGWMRQTTTALASPEASPREAPFHALQAREGTALFELPLPLPGLRGPVELWVEADREGRDDDDRPVRLLLALDLEGMGQVRLGVQSQGGRIHADLWVDEERRAAIARVLDEEMGDPAPYPVRVHGFHGPQPGLRRLAGAGPFGAMG